MELWLLVLVPIALVLTFSHYFKPQKSRHSKSKSKDSNPYHAVSVVNCEECCRAAEKLGEKRFLSKDAPHLPLPQCDANQCDCRYQHFEDRRVPGSDRRLEYGITHDLYGAFGEENRRNTVSGRRATDKH